MVRVDIRAGRWSGQASRFLAAMELSRKVVTKHWWKFLGFGIVLMLLLFAGVVAFFIGIFIAAPLILTQLMYAYEDIFGSIKQTAPVPPIAAGLSAQQ